MTHKLDSDDFFILRIQRFCAEAGLSFFLIEPVWAEAFLEKLLTREVNVKVLLNMHSEHHDPSDIFHRILIAASHLGTSIIDPLEVALPAFNKASIHTRLLEAGLAVPNTLIVPESEIHQYQLTEEQQAYLGIPFVIKPALGYGRKGLVLNATNAADLIRSHEAFPNSHYLLQRHVSTALINGEPAYFRGYQAFGKQWFCWWNPSNDRYRKLTAEEISLLQLAGLEETLTRIGQISKMQFFSSEITLSEDRQWVVIDYVNDQCHLLSQGSDPIRGIPDSIVEDIARSLVQGACSLVNLTPKAIA